MKTLNPRLPSRRLGLLVVATIAVAICGTLTPAAADSLGKLIWVELITEDAATAASFYKGLLDWNIEMRECTCCRPAYIFPAERMYLWSSASRPARRIGSLRSSNWSSSAGFAFFLPVQLEMTRIRLTHHLP